MHAQQSSEVKLSKPVLEHHLVQSKIKCQGSLPTWIAITLHVEINHSYFLSLVCYVSKLASPYTDDRTGGQRDSDDLSLITYVLLGHCGFRILLCFSPSPVTSLLCATIYKYRIIMYHITTSQSIHSLNNRGTFQVLVILL